MKVTLFLLVCLVLGACAAKWEYIYPKDTKRKLAEIELLLPNGWVVYNGHDNLYPVVTKGELISRKVKQMILTKNGLALDAIVIRRFDLKQAFPFIGKEVQADMLTLELSEMHIAEERLRRSSAVMTVKLNEPVAIAGKPGYRFHYVTKEPGGTSVENLTYGFICDGGLVTLTYSAPSLHFYPAGRADYMRVVNSLKLSK